MTSAKPNFKRQESWRYKRLPENWRRPRGVTSKMRKEESGWPRKVKVGYRTTAKTRGLHPRGLVDSIVWQVSDLEKLDSKLHIVRLARRVGERKRIAILDRARQLNFHIANPGKRESQPAPTEETGEGKTARTKAPALAAKEEPVVEKESAGESIEDEVKGDAE
jgi:large subunit ribosomal protein L32e